MLKHGRYAVFLKSTLLSLMILSNTVHATSPTIRVRIAESLKELMISGTDLSSYLHKVKSNKKYQGRSNIKFSCKNKNQMGLNQRVMLASLSSPTGMVGWNKELYRGSFDILSDKNQMSCDLINELSLEDYLSSLLAKEMSSSWPIEALKAQAVAARTYAYNIMNTSKNRFYDVENSEKHQVYGSFRDETKKTSSVSRMTKGEILVTKIGKQITPLFYHSKCGGRTLTPEMVWKNKVKGYKEVECPFCHGHGKREWKHRLSKDDVEYVVKKVLTARGKTNINKENKIEFLGDRYRNNYMKAYVDFEPVVFPKADFRRYLGREKIPSNNWRLFRGQKDHYLIYGDGNGHGVGMCQFGARELAKKGWGYKRILAHYYPGHKLSKVY